MGWLQRYLDKRANTPDAFGLTPNDYAEIDRQTRRQRRAIIDRYVSSMNAGTRAEIDADTLVEKEAISGEYRTPVRAKVTETPVTMDEGAKLREAYSACGCGGVCDDDAVDDGGDYPWSGIVNGQKIPLSGVTIAWTGISGDVDTYHIPFDGVHPKEAATIYRTIRAFMKITTDLQRGYGALSESLDIAETKYALLDEKIKNANMQIDAMETLLMHHGGQWDRKATGREEESDT